jgi:FkbM family methyltransferase
VFRLADVLMQAQRVWLPGRVLDAGAGRSLRREAQWQAEPDGAWRVRCLESGIEFYWPTEPDNNLHYVIEQEVCAGNPHHYTTAPIRIGPESCVLDVGACEGLFGFRVLRQGMARRVICFEPSETMARLARRGAARNGVAGGLEVEELAVGRTSGWVEFGAGARADRGMVGAPPEDGKEGVRQIRVVTLDEYCRSRELVLAEGDLIKVDAEGADFDVLRGAEGLIRARAPQIAVTTYHVEDHCVRMLEWLRQVQPRYGIRVKGLSFWTPTPRPVLLQAAVSA